MPLTSAIQSAMAIRHEREKRHQRRLSKIRRESGVGCKKIWSTLVQIVFAGGKILPVLAGGKSSGKCGGLTQTERIESWRCVDAHRGPFLSLNYEELLLRQLVLSKRIESPEKKIVSRKSQMKISLCRWTRPTPVRRRSTRGSSSSSSASS